jgi:protein ImuB
VPPPARRIACIRLTTLSDPDADARAALAGALLTAAPRVIPVRGHPRAWWADVTGMQGHGGDAGVGAALAQAAADAGWEAHVGVAGSCIAAAAGTRERATPVRVVPSGREAAYLRRRSLAIVPMPPDLRHSLELLGLRTCGDLGALVPAEVELRFGAEGLRAWRLARGDDARWPFRPAAPGIAAAEADFEPAIENAEPLRFVLGGLIGSVLGQLEARQRIPARLRLVLRVEDAPDDVREVRPARPTADARVLADLCRRAVDAEPLAGPVHGVLLVAEEEGTARADQLDAFNAPAPDPSALHSALLPVFARWGEGALSTAVHNGAHLPGEHAGWAARGSDGIAAVAQARPPGDDRSGDASVVFRNTLPLCLRRLPEPVPVTVREDAEQRPAQVDIPAVQNALQSGGIGGFPPRMWKTRAEGPERISGAWWARGTAREYWRVESPDGWLGLVFRDGGSGRWYLEGWYD